MIIPGFPKRSIAVGVAMLMLWLVPDLVFFLKFGKTYLYQGISALWSILVVSFVYYNTPKFAEWIAKKKILASGESVDRVKHAAHLLSAQFGQTLPEIIVVESDESWAKSAGLGEKSSTVFISTTLVNKLSDRSLVAVIAHEFTHVFKAHILMSLIPILVLLSSWHFYQKLTHTIPFSSVALILILLYFSREREFSADRGAAIALDKNIVLEAFDDLERISGKDKWSAFEFLLTHPSFASRRTAIEKLHQ